MNIKQNSGIKIGQIRINIFSNKILQVLIAHANIDDNAKRYQAQIYCLPKGIINNYNVINGGKFFDQPVVSGVTKAKN